MNFANLVVATVRNGQPALENAGHERFTGAEGEMDWSVTPAVRLEATYSYHDARFRDYVTAFDGLPAQLAGNRFEMTPLHMAAAGLVYAPARGLVGSAVVNYVGERYLNKRNTALAAAYTTVTAGVGYRFAAGELRVDGRNLTNRRPPVAESELGDAQYYLLPARSIDVTYRTRF
jgi:iron complex outermembrane receptor protein